MKLSNTELVQQLSEITKNLIFRSQTSSEFEPLLWETNERGILRKLRSWGFPPGANFQEEARKFSSIGGISISV